MELTDTNRPRACSYIDVRVHCAAPEIRSDCIFKEQPHLHLHRVSVIMAKGKHPAPFRTRKLSLSAPMVLHGGPCGRLGRCRTTTPQGRSFVTGPEVFLVQCFCAVTQPDACRFSAQSHEKCLNDSAHTSYRGLVRRNVKEAAVKHRNWRLIPSDSAP